MTSYRIAEAPRFAGQRNWDCCRCDHEQLRRPVFLEGPSGVFAAGVRCAAIMLGLVPETATSEEGRKALKAHTDELRAAEERTRRARADAENAVWQAWLVENAPDHDNTFERIQALGGYAAAKAAYRAARGNVAESC